MILIRCHLCMHVILRVLCYRATSYGYRERYALADLIRGRARIHLGLNVYCYQWRRWRFRNCNDRAICWQSTKFFFRSHTALGYLASCFITDVPVECNVMVDLHVPFCYSTMLRTWFPGASNNDPTLVFCIRANTVFQLSVALQLEFEGGDFERSQCDRNFAIFLFNLFQVIL